MQKLTFKPALVARLLREGLEADRSDSAARQQQKYAEKGKKTTPKRLERSIFGTEDQRLSH